MQIKQVMYKKVHTILPSADLKTAMKLMIKKKISGLVVVDKDKNLLGILSEKDIYRSFYPSYSDFYSNPESFTDFESQEQDIKNKLLNQVQSVMTTPAISVKPTEQVMKIGAIMLAKNIHRIPVVDEKERLVGVVTRGCIYKTLFKKYLKLK
ncbi:MAG: CBS domain-containing protein [Patescibacteria group bacterium]|jgi:CBS domain-containing protein